MKFNPNDYPYYTVMHVETKEQDLIFRTFLDTCGKRWSSGDSYMELTYFDTLFHRTGIYYRFEEGTWSTHRPMRDTILNFSDFDWSDLAPPEEEKPVALRFTW